MTQKGMLMLDDFFIRALLAGIGTALIAGPLGCFIVWRRMAYFGDTIAHAALLGVVLALAFNLSVSLGVLAVAAIIALLLLAMQNQRLIASDTLLGILSHSALAIGLVALSFMHGVRIDINGLLFGDILSVSRVDVGLIWLGALLVGGVLAMIWRAMLTISVDRDIAAAEGINVRLNEAIYVLLLAALIAMAIKVVGVLLITSMLVIPAATARRLSTSPETMALGAIVLGTLAVVGGLYGSLEFDSPAGPSIVVTMFILFLAGLAYKKK
jgi:zinc transport system permease protein